MKDGNSETMLEADASAAMTRAGPYRRKFLSQSVLNAALAVRTGASPRSVLYSIKHRTRHCGPEAMSLRWLNLSARSAIEHGATIQNVRQHVMTGLVQLQLLSAEDAARLLGVGTEDFHALCQEMDED